MGLFVILMFAVIIVSLWKAKKWLKIVATVSVWLLFLIVMLAEIEIYDDEAYIDWLENEIVDIYIARQTRSDCVEAADTRNSVDTCTVIFINEVVEKEDSTVELWDNYRN